MRTVIFLPRALSDLQELASFDAKVVPRVLRILAECTRSPC
jgi:hypothetical protein